MTNDRTCVVLGTDDARNLALLRAALRNPQHRILIGELSGSAEDLVRRADQAAGEPAFERWPASAEIPNDDSTIVFDGRSTNLQV